MERTIVKPLAVATFAIASLVAACSSGSDASVDALSLEARKARLPPAIQTQLDPTSIPRFVDELPLPAANADGSHAGGLHAIAAGTSRLTLRMCEFEAQMLPRPLPPTVIWGYVYGACPTRAERPRDSFIGPVILAERGTPTEIQFVNELGTTDTTRVLAWKYGTDQTIHWADPLTSDANGQPIGMQNACAHGGMEMMLPTGSCATNYSGPIPAVPHLHGGEVPSSVDGGPDQWFTSDGLHHGADYYTADATAGANAAVFRYPNVQEPAPLWFHDHTLGATRLNVYAGLAGAYLLNDGETADPSLPSIPVPLIIQDRMFDAHGQLFFQSGFTGGTLWALNPEHPFWNPEFIGDTIVVNGKTWPNLTVEPKRYRFLVLNGSNARAYELFLETAAGAPGPALWVIGNDGGLLDLTAQANPLVIMPGERYEVVVDFDGFAAGTKLVLRNSAAAPYPFGDEVDVTPTVKEIMQFTVGACTSGKCGDADDSFDPAAPGASPRAKPMVRLAAGGQTTAGVAPTLVRQLTLNEVMSMMPMDVSTDIYAGISFRAPVLKVTAPYPAGPLEVLLNNTKWGETPTETPREGTTEIWEIVNLTADAHPIHLHLVQFQILNRQRLLGGEDEMTGELSGYFLEYANAFGGAFNPAAGPPGDYGSPASPNGTKNVPGVPGDAIPYVGGNPDVTEYLDGPIEPPAAWESGWKDTAFVPPGYVTRYVVRWAPTDVAVTEVPELLAYPFDPGAGPGYVWHCHIIDHEDNEMMRPTAVLPTTATVTRSFVLP